MEAATAFVWGCIPLPRADCSSWLDEVLLALLVAVDVFPVTKCCVDAVAYEAVVVVAGGAMDWCMPECPNSLEIKSHEEWSTYASSAF